MNMCSLLTWLFVTQYYVKSFPHRQTTAVGPLREETSPGKPMELQKNTCIFILKKKTDQNLFTDVL